VLLFSFLASSQAMAIVYTEDFSDPLGDWVSGWLYTGSNLQNYYVASGNCDDNNRGNQPDGLWVSDDKVCGSLNSVSPVTINLDANIGDTAAYFSLDAYACDSDVTLNIYDRLGALDSSILLPATCFTFSNYEFNLSNGISAFEFEAPSSAIEGNTAIDNVVLDTEGRIIDVETMPVPTMQFWGAAFLIMALFMTGFLVYRRQD
jgi:hypothetical protein